MDQHHLAWLRHEMNESTTGPALGEAPWYDHLFEAGLHFSTWLPANLKQPWRCTRPTAEIRFHHHLEESDRVRALRISRVPATRG